MYCAAQDVAVSGLYWSCVRRGDIAKMPQLTGACVFMEGLGHVGVYVGDGYVVEASGHAKGVVRTRLKDRGWALWGLPGWISYGDAPCGLGAGRGGRRRYGEEQHRGAAAAAASGRRERSGAVDAAAADRARVFLRLLPARTGTSEPARSLRCGRSSARTGWPWTASPEQTHGQG
ncbi:MAG: hypothetical protein V8S72_05570 [Oscillospiraceae bacterium]